MQHGIPTVITAGGVFDLDNKAVKSSTHNILLTEENQTEDLLCLTYEYALLRNMIKSPESRKCALEDL